MTFGETRWRSPEQTINVDGIESEQSGCFSITKWLIYKTQNVDETELIDGLV